MPACAGMTGTQRRCVNLSGGWYYTDQGTDYTERKLADLQNTCGFMEAQYYSACGSSHAGYCSGALPCVASTFGYRVLGVFCPVPVSVTWNSHSSP